MNDVTSVTFRLTHADDANVDRLVDALKTALSNSTSRLGAIAQTPVVTRAAESSGSGSSSLSAGAIGAVVVIILVLVGVIGFVVWRNRQLKYQNYRLLQAKGAPTGTLYDDEADADADGTPPGGLRFHPAGASLEEDDEASFGIQK